MSFPQKNKKTQDSSERTVKLTKRYSTRQIMELTEKRRQQMLEEDARLAKLIEPPAVELPKTDQPQNDPSIKNTVFPQEQQKVVAKPKVEESSVPDGKTIAGFFRQEPENPTEEIVSDLIEQEFNKAAQYTAPAVEAREEVLSVEALEKKFERIEQPAAPLNTEPKNAGRSKRPSEILLSFMEAAFFIAAPLGSAGAGAAGSFSGAVFSMTGFAPSPLGWMT